MLILLAGRASWLRHGRHIAAKTTAPLPQDATGVITSVLILASYALCLAVPGTPPAEQPGQPPHGSRVCLRRSRSFTTTLKESHISCQRTCPLFTACSPAPEADDCLPGPDSFSARSLRYGFSALARLRICQRFSTVWQYQDSRPLRESRDPPQPCHWQASAGHTARFLHPPARWERPCHRRHTAPWPAAWEKAELPGDRNEGRGKKKADPYREAARAEQGVAT